jgi:cysteine desulfurase
MHVYLDHAASTPLKPEALAAMQEVLANPQLQANPSSGHELGKASKAQLAELRGKVAARFACSPEDVVFNSGGSEGDTHALLGAAWLLGKPCHIAISAFEHEAVEMAARRLGALGHRVSILPVAGDGTVPLEAVEAQFGSDRPDIVSVMAVNNEVGTLQPVCEIGRLCRQHDTLFHSDAVRAIGHGLPGIECCPDITLLNGTAHKFGGPRGVGFLIQRGVRLPQLVCGGGQESGSRAGTENLAGIAGLAAALELATPETAVRLEELKAQLEGGLRERFPACLIHGAAAPRATHVTSVAFPGMYNRELQAALDARGICVGTGKACHDAHAADNSGVLGAMRVPFHLQRGTLRISLGWTTTAGETAMLLEALEELVPVSGSAEPAGATR